MSCPECGKVCGDMVSHIKSKHKGMDWRGIKTPCPYEDCDKVVVDIQNHIRLVHLKIKNFECAHCEAKFSNRYQVRNHISGVHSNIREKCPHCDQMLKITTLKSHIKNVHEGGGQRVSCQDCPKTFQSNADLERHVVSVHMKIKAPCPECGRRFRMETLANHIKTQHKGIYPFKCKECGKGFQDSNHLHTHVRTRHYGVFVYCKAENEKGETCGKKLYSEEGLQKHIERVHLKQEEGKEMPCLECGVKILPSSLQRHIDEVHSKIARKACPIENCGEVFANKYIMQKHVDKVHDKVFNREWCDLCEEYKQDLKSHYKHVHTDHEQLPCTWPQCLYRAKTKQYLERHIKYVHERKTRVSCEECGKSVRDLYHHKRVVHRKDNLYFCTECNKGFPIKSQLRNHINKIHLKIRQSCPDCGAEVANLQQHIRFVHEKRMAAVCDVPGCETKFANRLSKKKHMQSVHEGVRDTCPECGKQVTSLKSHMRIVHEKIRAHTCNECKKNIPNKNPS
jgi:KRAB domain-containing zinc finger protein